MYCNFSHRCTKTRLPLVTWAMYWTIAWAQLEMQAQAGEAWIAMRVSSTGGCPGGWPSWLRSEGRHSHCDIPSLWGGHYAVSGGKQPLGWSSCCPTSPPSGQCSNTWWKGSRKQSKETRASSSDSQTKEGHCSILPISIAINSATFCWSILLAYEILMKWREICQMNPLHLDVLAIIFVKASNGGICVSCECQSNGLGDTWGLLPQLMILMMLPEKLSLGSSSRKPARFPCNIHREWWSVLSGMHTGCKAIREVSYTANRQSQNVIQNSKTGKGQNIQANRYVRS